MNIANKEMDVYGLVSELCKRFIDKHTPEQHPYLPPKDNSTTLKKLRSRAYEILLKKSAKNYDDNDRQDADPIAELLKYAFVLKTALRRSSKAEELENALNFLTENKDELDFSVYSTLQFLNGLKSLDLKDENSMNVFHYGKPNPLLPEEPQDPKEVPRFQIYPIEAFIVPERFEAMLGIKGDCLIRDNSRDPRSTLSFGHIRSAGTIGIETLGSRSEHTIGSILSVPRYTVRLVSTREFSTASYFMPEITEDSNGQKDEYSTGHIGRLPGPEPPWLCFKSARTEYETNSEISDAQSINFGYDEKAENEKNSAVIVWENVVNLPEFPEHRTWESLGEPEASKEPPFITETSKAMLHLERIKQAGFLPLLSRKVVESLNTITEVPTKEFLENIKLLLLGVESRTFTWNEKGGFSLRQNTTIPGLSVKALHAACSEVIYWGACYRLLSILIKPVPQTGKMLQEGLIFQAMCNSVKELLVYYQAVILRITVADDDDSSSLLKLLMNVRPVGTLISEVLRLCRCDRENQSALGDGTGLLSHIYEQVTKITKPSVALVFYSILKSCCEVYFRFLQKWLFEGIIDDNYGEFLIKIRPQFLREKSHRFWTKGFAINANSVPGFLSHLADSILDCGKTVKLLRICDPNNPLCTMFATSHPAVRVCLSVGMVREQEILCREFLLKGEEALGKNISFSFAFEEQRIAEKEKADRNVEAQHETLMRIKREREEAKKEVARNKRELLAQLKDQAEEVATRKENERKAELLKDKQFLEDMNAAEELAIKAELAEKKNTLNYYNELAAEAEKRRVRADWRLKRMKLFQQRVDSITTAKKELSGIEKSDLASSPQSVSPKNETEEKSKKCAQENNDSCKNITRNEAEVKEIKSVSVEDENKNPTQPEIGQFIENKEPEAPPEMPEKKMEKIEEKLETAPKKSPRPCVLDINRTRMMSGSAFANLNDYRDSLEITNNHLPSNLNRPNDLQFNTQDNSTAAQRNKLKVLQEEYGMTPNNNELNIILMDAQGNKNTICIDTATVNPDNLRITTETDGNENCADENLTEAQKNRNRNITHYSEDFDEFIRPHRVPGSINLTDAQKNRKRNMTHTYNDALEEKEPNKVNFADLTEMQKNRAKIMGHDHRNYQDYVPEQSQVGDNCLDLLTPLSMPIMDDGVTPMSCTTDTFPLSMSSSITQFQNCEDDFFKSGNQSTTTPGDFASEDLQESRPSTGFNFPRVNQVFPNFFGIEAAVTPTFNSSLTVEDVEMIDNTSLQVYLEKSVTIPLKIQSRLANAAIIKHMLYERKILSHLHSLRSFFFLLNGEFAKSLTGSLYKRLYEISVPLELFQSATLTNILENAINSSLSSSYANSRLLSLSVTDIPTQLQVSNPEFLNCLCLSYKISWPLNIILDERLIQQYTKVFKFLLMVGRVLYVLQEDFHLLKVERKAATSDQYHKLQLYRHSMMQFITALHNYLTCSVLHASWAEFEKHLEQATTLDQLYDTHVTYIKKILSRCMLTSRAEKMRNFLCNIFKIILKFHNRVRSQNWTTAGGGYTHANFERLEQMYQTFCEARTYLAHVANKLASSGYQPHLTHFLNALNINPLYDLTDMNSSKKS